jgi:NADH-quinone oxidoreductase subunit A
MIRSFYEEEAMDTPAGQVLLWPFAVYFFAVAGMVATVMALSYFLGERHRERLTGEPYESGIAATGTARIQFDIKFYLIAMFFVIFDLEAVFVFAWAVSLHESGWAGFVEMLIFIGILLAALLYLWKRGALEWGTSRRKRPAAG